MARLAEQLLDGEGEGSAGGQRRQRYMFDTSYTSLVALTLPCLT